MLRSAEHGCFLKYTDHSDWYNLLEEIDLGWKNDVLPIFEASLYSLSYTRAKQMLI